MAKKTKKTRKVIKINDKERKLVRKKTRRITSQEGQFRDKMELVFGVTDPDFLSELYIAMMSFSNEVTRLKLAYGIPIVDIVQFRKESKEESN